MQLSFREDELRELCNTQALLRARFGECGVIVARRLLTLSSARVLGEITVRPPDRRRLEPRLGPCAASVCARDAGRIYFNACGLDGREQRPFDEVDHIEIFAIARSI